jgi:signal transduction histidine kinase
MKFNDTDLYATLMHEIKNHLGLLGMTIDGIPLQGERVHDKAVDDARLLCQGVIDRLQQALLIYKAANGQIHPSIDAYSTEDFVHELRDTTASLSHGRLQVETHIDAAVPAIWFFDRTLIEMALVNAIHNSLAYARSKITIEAEMEAGGLLLSVRDDSPGFPEHVLHSVANDTPYRSTGTGLGLQFAKMIVQTHENRGRKGELRLSNAPGALFQLLVP